MKLALVHDYLCGKGGAERVFQYMCEEFPDADIFTVACNPSATYPFFGTRHIRTTWLNPFVRTMDAFRWSFPLSTHAMEGFDLSSYDVVLSSSATVGKYLKVPNGSHICYCYIPTRALWQFDQYFSRGLKSALIKLFLPHLQRRDLAAASRVNRFIAISEVSAAHIKRSYGRDAEIIPCPVDLSMFRPAPKKEHFLIVSRLEHWKRVDYAICAFNELGLPLRVIGTGNEENRLKGMAGPNITFLGGVDDETLAREYGEARAVVFTPDIEYGLIPLESLASGTPVICLGKGGVLETLCPIPPGAEGPTDANAVFFDAQEPSSLIQAVKRFEKVSFSAECLMAHAARWSVPEFKKKMRALVRESWVKAAKR
jgi:glycosyltransferase involved in cell wall biosynthesis